MITNEEFEIPDDSPFQNDKLNRELISENLEKIIVSASGSLVLSIDASWGNGKTTFIKMWRKKLDKTDRYRTLYFNAWENDDCGDPLLALISGIEEVLNREHEKPYIAKIKETGKNLLKKAIPTLLKIATSGIVDITDTNLDDPAKSYIIEGAGKLGEFELYKEQKISKDKFRKALAEYQENENRKVIFFIDELDRCRPTFAIETLEKIKHLFNINDFIFVLALDKRQLSHSIKTLYGQGMDSVGYLRRFIDFEFVLPEPDRSTYTDFLLTKFELRNNNTQYFELYLTVAIKAYDLSLRDIEKLFYYLKLIVPITPLFIRNIPENQDYTQIYLEVLGAIYAIFPVLKIKDNGVYRKFVNRETIDNGDLMTMYFEDNDRLAKNGRSIVGNILSINNMFKTTNMNIVSSNGFVIGNEGGYQDNRFNMLFLLDETKTAFSFIKQLEFIDNFVIPNREN